MWLSVGVHECLCVHTGDEKMRIGFGKTAILRGGWWYNWRKSVMTVTTVLPEKNLTRIMQWRLMLCADTSPFLGCLWHWALSSVKWTQKIQIKVSWYGREDISLRKLGSGEWFEGRRRAKNEKWEWLCGRIDNDGRTVRVEAIYGWKEKEEWRSIWIWIMEETTKELSI